MESESFGLVNSSKFSRLHARKPHFGNAHPWRERGSDPSGLAGRQWEAGSWKTLAASPGGIATERGNPRLGRPGNPASGDAALAPHAEGPRRWEAIKRGGLCQARQRGVSANRGRAAKFGDPCRFGTGRLTRHRGTAGTHTRARRPTPSGRQAGRCDRVGTGGRLSGRPRQKWEQRRCSTGIKRPTRGGPALSV